MSNIPPSPIFSPQTTSIMGATTPLIGGNETGGGKMSMNQVLALLTATNSQMGEMLAEAMKSNVKNVMTTMTLPLVSRLRFLVLRTIVGQKF